MNLKALLPLLMVACFFIGLNAQTEKGVFSIGLSAKPCFVSPSILHHRQFMFDGNIEAGYFFKDNFEIGAEYGFFRTTFKYLGDVSYEISGFNLGIYGKKYYKLKNPNWKPFIKIGTGYNFWDLDYPEKYSFLNVTRNSLYVKADVGIAYFMNKHLSFDMAIDNQLNFGSYGLRMTSGLKLGVHWNFNGKKKK